MDITIEQFRNFVGNHIFTATAIKKDGTERIYNGRLGVKKYVKGTQPETTAKRNATLAERNMIGIFEMPSGEYRTLNLNTLISLKVNGQTFTA